ncbi:MAG: capsule assembly Wzi family protein [Treponema sp.]|nr:capsule assembly Wzi family protein [Treponema sp.]
MQQRNIGIQEYAALPKGHNEVLTAANRLLLQAWRGFCIKKKLFSVFITFIFLSPAFSQEALLSETERYYDFLALQGLTERSYLNFRTLSDSVWELDEDAAHPWQGHNLGIRRNLFGDVTMRIYGPELFTSVNTAAPYGQNDGALWQGRGFNAAFTAGVRFEGYGVEATFKPQVSFSQNAGFAIMDSPYDSKYGYFWSYGGNAGVDAPQRFGDKPFFTFDWGDSEIRYSWKTLTIGFGTQSIWLGPAYLNPILHSNNAPTYPRLDMGLRKQPVTIPGLDWYMGDVEFRIWTGYLSESDYFDNDDTNDHTMFHGLSLAYAPSFLPGLTLSANRVCLVAWEWENMKYIVPLAKNRDEDQKASFSLSWIFPRAGLEIYGEIGIDDFVGGGFWGYIRYPFHTMVYTTGFKKTIDFISIGERKVFGVIALEWHDAEMSQDFQYMWPYTFYFHHKIIHGYTNRGQFIGNGNGAGGNSQHLEFSLYYPEGSFSIFINRNNPDNNFFYREMIEQKATDTSFGARYFWSWKANLVIGANTEYFLSESLKIGGGVVYNLILNPLFYYKDNIGKDEYLHNFSFQLSVKYEL